jgi:hypothetical protein
VVAQTTERAHLELLVKAMLVALVDLIQIFNLAVAVVVQMRLAGMLLVVPEVLEETVLVRLLQDRL